MKLRFVLLALLIAIAWVSPAFADIQAVTFSNSAPQHLSNAPFTLGWAFQVNSPIDVTWLSLFDEGRDGLAESHQVGIWDAVGTLLVSATVSAGTADPLHDQYRAVAVVPVLLNPGFYRLGSVFTSGSDAIIFPGKILRFASAPEISFAGNAYIPGRSLANPTKSTGTYPAYFGPSFEFTEVPEPASIMLLGTLLLLSGFALRRRLAPQKREK